MNVLDRPVSRWLAIGVAAVAAAVAIAIAPAAQADSTPVGRLPKGPLATIQTTKGQLVSVALPRPSESSGLVWRIARDYDDAVVEQVSEADVDDAVVLVFRAKGKGQATLRFAQTEGDSSSKAVKSADVQGRGQGPGLAGLLTAGQPRAIATPATPIRVSATPVACRRVSRSW